MKSALSLTFAAALMAVGASASSLSPAQAIARAQNATVAPMRAAASRIASKQPLYTASTDNGLPSLYVFGTATGFVMLSADDCAAPTVAYSSTAAFDPDNIPPALQALISAYTAEIAAAQAVNAVFKAISAPAREAIDEMLTTSWNQNAPFNDLTPRIDSVATYTGCVATAMAQVMNYHHYPASGSGQISYTWQSQTLSLDFSTISFDWNDMLDSYAAGTYTEAQATAVATLMKACGYAVQMDYGTSESSASSYSPQTALRQYFGYSPALSLELRDVYTLQDWNDLIYASLANDCPVIYGGTNSSSGHCFVIDGYSTDNYFHVNWGWGGLSNGYFLLSVLSPGEQGIGGSSSGYNQNQCAIINARPADTTDTASTNICETEVMTATTSANTVEINGFFANLGYDSATITPGLLITDNASADTIAQTFETSAYTLPSMNAFSSWSPADLDSYPAGSYRLYPIYKTTDGSVQPVKILNTLAGYVLATKANDGTVTASVPTAGTYYISDIDTVTPIYTDTQFLIEATLTADTDEENTIDIIPLLLDTTGSIAATGDTAPTDVAPGSQQISYTGQLHPLSSDTIAAGTYSLIFAQIIGSNSQGASSLKAISQPIALTLTAAPTLQVQATSWEINNGARTTDSSLLQVHADIEVSQGLYANRAIMFIFPLEGGQSVGYVESSIEFITAGTSQTISFSGTFSGTPGTTYQARLYYINSDGGYTSLSDSAKTFTVAGPAGLSTTTADTEIAHATYYDLNGCAIAHPTHGLYVRHTPGESHLVHITAP